MIGLILGFLLPMVGYAYSLIRGGLQTVSETENRQLAALPLFEGDLRDYTTEFDRYLEDNFGFRMILIRVARKIRDNLGENPPQVVTGKDGWLFLGQSAYRDEFEGYGQWTNQQVEDWIDSFSEVRSALASDNIPFAAFVAVDKARAYPENLPEDWTEGERRFRTSLYTHPDVAMTGLVDAERFVLDAKARGRQTFFLRDTHWTSDGTYDLAMALMDIFDPDLRRARYLPGPPRPEPTTRLLDLERMAGFETSEEPSHALLPFPPTRPGFRTSITLKEDGTPDPSQFSTLKILGTETATPGRLVIVGDSFADTMVGHFRPSFSEIIRIHHKAHFGAVSLEEVLSYNPDAVLFATAERQAVMKSRPFAPLTTEGKDPGH